MVLSKAQLKGLAATARGEVIRTHTRVAYTITGPVGSKALWQLMREGLIADGPTVLDQTQTPMILTASGEAVLSATETS